MRNTQFEQMIDQAWLKVLIQAAASEDLGERGDITTLACVPEEMTSEGVFRVREAGVVAGLPLLEKIAGEYGDTLKINLLKEDGEQVSAGDELAEVSGRLREILMGERVMLNFMSRLSGIATLTHRYVEAVSHTKAGIYDTRKTTPGWRGLEKYAVVCGGGCSHRIGLYDAMLVKDNHIAHLSIEALYGELNKAIERVRGLEPKPTFVEIEVDTLAQLEEVLGCDVDVVLLDNMGLAMLSEAVKLRDEKAPKVKLEASGGVNLETVVGIAETGVDRIAIGGLTHSAVGLDIGLDIEGD